MKKIRINRAVKENLNSLVGGSSGIGCKIRIFSEDVFNPKLVPKYVTNISVSYNIEDNKKYFKYCYGNVKTVQIDVEKEFNQMVEDYNQFPKNTSINPLDIEGVTTDELIKKNEEKILQQEENVRQAQNKFMNDITNSEYTSILLKRLSYQKQLFVEFVSKLILKGKITLEEIPQDLRINNRTIYISSLRISRSSCNSLIKDLKLILSDIEYMSSSDKENIITILSNEIQYLEIKYLGDKQLEDFKRTIPTEILQRL